MPQPLQLFEAFGVEIEYMIVDAETLTVLPIADRLLEAVAGEIVSEVEFGDISWSNELALHVIELKTSAPAPRLADLPAAFSQNIHRITELLRPMNARLLPTGMHPLMDPHTQLKLWPHDYNPVYEAYNRIFDCRGHGWANLQSTHLNLPFRGDDQFGRLHAAIRLILPLLPALAASSPVIDGHCNGIADNRMRVYRNNSRRIPSITGQVVPEAAFSHQAYREQVLEPMYADIAAFDPAGILQHEWLNSRGAIARFERNAIEIRVLDAQEHPAADVAILELVVAVLQALVAERWTSYEQQQELATEDLAELLATTTVAAEQAIIADRRLLAQFGLSCESLTAAEFWNALSPQFHAQISQLERLNVILKQGPLARRIQRRLEQGESLKAIYGSLCL